MLRRRRRLGKYCFRGPLVIDHELQRDPRPSRPIGAGRGAPVANHVAGIGLSHRIRPQIGIPQS